jgi:tRNA(Ile)-lysidine synthase
LVAKTAQKYGLRFEVGYGHLGPNASEDKARQARYRFLRKTRAKHKADSIITAHHQDDLIETAILNLLRGTGARGFSPMNSNADILRPLLSTTKKQILDYAKRHNIIWREDPSNQDLTILRNYVRHQLLSKLKRPERQELLEKIDKVAKIDSQTRPLIATLSRNIKKNSQIDREEFARLPTEIAEELVLYWLRQQKATDADRATIRRLNLALKTAKANTLHSVRKDLWLSVDLRKAHFTTSVSQGWYNTAV